jgi:hypothetical protein
VGAGAAAVGGAGVGNGGAEGSCAKLLAATTTARRVAPRIGRDVLPMRGPRAIMKMSVGNIMSKVAGKLTNQDIGTVEEARASIVGEQRMRKSA